MAKPVALVLNKIDIVDKPSLLELSKTLYEHHDFVRSFMVSAAQGKGVQDIMHWLSESLPQGPWLFPEDHLTDVPERQLAAEITREKLFMRLRQELPYSLAVETESWEDKADGSVKISQVVYVQKDGQKQIVIGKNGENLKAIGFSARKEMSRIFERQVHLFLFVKVSEDWKDKPEMYKNIGLEYKN